MVFDLPRGQGVHSHDVLGMAFLLLGIAVLGSRRAGTVDTRHAAVTRPRAGAFERR